LECQFSGLAICSVADPTAAVCVRGGGQRTTRSGGVADRARVTPASLGHNQVSPAVLGKAGGHGPFPAILFIHGYQDPPRPGASVYARAGRLGQMAKRGYVAAALSQPGYGNSGGPPDFCRPFTQQAALVALDFLRRQTLVRRQNSTVRLQPGCHRRGYGRRARSEPGGPPCSAPAPTTSLPGTQ